MTSASLDRSFDFDSSSSTAAGELKKDRRTMLEEWRAQVRAKEKESNNNGNSNGNSNTNASASDSGPNSMHVNALSITSTNENTTPTKRIRMESSTNGSDMYVPSTSASASASAYAYAHTSSSASTSTSASTSASASVSLPLPPVEGMTAVERFRMRRKQRLMQQQKPGEISGSGSGSLDDTNNGNDHANGCGSDVNYNVSVSNDNRGTISSNANANVNVNANLNAGIGMPPIVPILSVPDRSNSSVSTCSLTDCSNSTAQPPQLPSSSSSKSTICFDDDSSSVYAGGRVSFGVGSRMGVGSTPTRIHSRRKSSFSGGARRRTANLRSGRKSMGGITSASGSASGSTGAGAGASVSSSISSGISNRSEFVSGASAAMETSSAISNGINPIIGSDLNQEIKASWDAHEDTDQPGIHSRIVLMEKRIQELEREKMALSMSKAPLESRLRQKEDQWMKEQNRYEEEIDALMITAQEETERIKGIENEFEEVQQENRRLRLEMRKQTLGSNEKNSGSSDNWNRQLQNDRDVQEYKDKLRSAEEEIKALRLEKVSIESEIKATNLQLSALMRDFDDIQKEYEEIQSEKESNRDAEIQLEELTKEHTATLALLNATSGELASLRSQSKFEMEKREREVQEEKEKMLFEMSVLKSRAANDHDEDMSTDGEDEAVLRARIEERDRRIEQLEVEVMKGEQVRREMHNTIQELRGNIRVFVRTRPFLPGDDGSASSPLDLHPDGENLSIESKAKNHDFKFDKVFVPSSGQDAVFGEVSEFVQSALDGYHVCLFSYGQTGSGKTHTMQGSGSGAMKGIIPRAVEQILNQAHILQKQKWTFTISASFLEIYNEELKDLLVNMNEGVVTQSSGMSTRNQNQNKLAIRRERDGKSYVAGLKRIKICTENAEEGLKCLKKLMTAAARARSVASTKMNAVSSRSHSVFMLHLNGSNDETGAVVNGALNLCDLAGSERLDRSGAGNDAKRLKETQAINKSLSCLGDVFTSLSNGSSHVPFRNSKLTYLLQDCLSGDGKALMFVNLSPTVESSGESLCSLRFAQRVNQVELGKATKHISYSKLK